MARTVLDIMGRSKRMQSESPPAFRGGTPTNTSSHHPPFPVYKLPESKVRAQSPAHPSQLPESSKSKPLSVMSKKLPSRSPASRAFDLYQNPQLRSVAHVEQVVEVQSKEKTFENANPAKGTKHEPITASSIGIKSRTIPQFSQDHQPRGIANNRAAAEQIELREKLAQTEKALEETLELAKKEAPAVSLKIHERFQEKMDAMSHTHKDQIAALRKQLTSLKERAKRAEETCSDDTYRIMKRGLLDDGIFTTHTLKGLLLRERFGKENQIGTILCSLSFLCFCYSKVHRLDWV
jgi:hypothetical protein